MSRHIRPYLYLIAPYLLAIVAAGVSVLALLPEPPAAPLPPRADYVILVGVAGLRWDDIDRTTTPTLWHLAESGAIGALSVRSAEQTTCPDDGWVTLGAGNRARRTSIPVDGRCPPLDVMIESGSQGSAYLSDQRNTVRDNRLLPWLVQPGALAEAVRCTTVVGPGAAIAGARPFGRIDRYVSGVDGGLQENLRSCSFAIVDAGIVEGEGRSRQSAAREADIRLSSVMAARPDHSLVLVAGLSDTVEASRLHVAIAEGAGYHKGWLTSAATGRPGYVQLIDLAPTVLTSLDRPVPNNLFVGSPMERKGDRPPHLSEAVDRLADADRHASVQRVIAGWFFLVLAIGQIALFLAVTPILRRIHRLKESSAETSVPRGRRVTAEVGLIAASLAIPAALLADLVPWWRSEWPWAVFVSVTVAVLVVVTAAIAVLTRGPRVMGPIGAVATVAAVAVAMDVMTGARLQINGVAGYSAVTGGRYSGLGTIGLGVLVGGALLLAGVLSMRVSRAWRPCVVAAVGAIGVVVVGSPYLGDDAAGAVALSAGVCLAVSAVSGGWLTPSRIGGAVITAVVVTSVFAVLDLTRLPSQRGNVGRFLVDLGDGTGGLAGQRLGENNVVTIASSPLTLLIIGSGLFLWFTLLRPAGGLRRLFGLYPAIRATLGGICVTTIFAGLVEGVGLNVLGAAASIAVPLVTVGALRALSRMDYGVVTLRSARDTYGGRTQDTSSEGDLADTTSPGKLPEGKLLA